MNEVLTEEKTRAFTGADSNYNALLKFGSKGNKITTAFVKRASLHQMLRRGVQIEYGKRFTRFTQTGNKVTAYFEDGSEVTSGTNFIVQILIVWQIFWLVQMALTPAFVLSTVQT